MDLSAKLEFLGEQVSRIRQAEFSNAILNWIKTNPGQSVWFAYNGVLILTPGVVAIPFLSSIGFVASGPVPG